MNEKGIPGGVPFHLVLVRVEAPAYDGTDMGTIPVILLAVPSGNDIFARCLHKPTKIQLTT
jgi:hypothetical protein